MLFQINIYIQNDQPMFDKKVVELNFTGADTVTSIVFSKEKPGSSEFSMVITNLVVVVVFLHGTLHGEAITPAPRVPYSPGIGFSKTILLVTLLMSSLFQKGLKSSPNIFSIAVSTKARSQSS